MAPILREFPSVSSVPPLRALRPSVPSYSANGTSIDGDCCVKNFGPFSVM
jgi:hypothetical protein